MATYPPSPIGKEFLELPKPHHHVSRLMILVIIVVAIVILGAVYSWIMNGNPFATRIPEKPVPQAANGSQSKDILGLSPSQQAQIDAMIRNAPAESSLVYHALPTYSPAQTAKLNASAPKKSSLVSHTLPPASK